MSHFILAWQLAKHHLASKDLKIRKNLGLKAKILPFGKEMENQKQNVQKYFLNVISKWWRSMTHEQTVEYH